MKLLTITLLLCVSLQSSRGSPSHRRSGSRLAENGISNLSPAIREHLRNQNNNNGDTASMGEHFLFGSEVAPSLQEFAFDVYRRITPDVESGENMVFSPISLHSILYLLMPGLNGQSLKQVQTALRESGELSPALQQEAEMCREVFRPSPDHVLIQTNRIYISNEFQLLKSYKNTINEYHRAPIKKLDFSKPRQSRSRINRYVANATRNEIEELIPADGIDALTKMVLINTVYLEAPWAFPFSETSTRMRSFRVSEHEPPIMVPTMENDRARCSVHISPELNSRMIILPFEGYSLSMVIFEPQRIGDFSAFERPSSTVAIRRAMEQAWSRPRPLMSSCSVQIPKFSIDFDVSKAKKLFKAMGMTDIFDEGAADFTKMSPTPHLYVSDVRHKAAIKVTEGGVKAAAASSVGISWRMLPLGVHINKPFMFMIRHETTGAILFLGKVVRPEFTDQ